MARFKDAELQAVLDEVATDLSKAAEELKADLVKAVPPQEEGDEAPAPASDSSPSPDAPPESSDAPPAMSPPTDGSPPASPASAAASPDPAAPAPDGAPLTPEALQAEYSQLPPEELDMHIQAALAAKEALSPSPAGPPGMGAPPAAPPMASPSPAGPPAMKGEMKTDAKANGGKITAGDNFGKSETKIAELEKLVKSQAEQLKSQGEDVENLVKVIKGSLQRPVQKAVTSITELQYIRKSEDEVKPAAKPAMPKTMAEVKARLNEMIPTLSKAERETVTGFYEHRVTIDKLAPLFEKAAK